MKNKELADIFERIAALLEIFDENVFRINSYHRVARTLGDLAEDVEVLARDGRLEEVEGIGKSTAEKIRQYLATGRIQQYEELASKAPPELPKLLAIPHLGPKTVAKLWKQAGITSPAQLKEAIEKQPAKLIDLPGMGPKKVQQIRESLAFIESAGGRITLGAATALAAGLIETVRKCRGANQVVAAGSLRRGRETIGDIDLLCEAPDAAAGEIIETFTSADNVANVLAKGATKGSVVLEGDVQADLRVVPKASFGAALAYFTGSKAHNVRLRELAARKGWKLNEYGLFEGDKPLAGKDEEGIYKALRLPWIAPELREDRGELAAAAEGKLPELIQPADVRGDFHMHTVASDGAGTIEQMIEACLARGYKYMAICDHSKGQIQANGLDEKRLRRHVKDIHAAAKKFPDILVLAGCEVDIHKDGSLDFADDVLAELDFVMAAPHSALSMAGKEATDRLIAAMANPHVNCIAHPSGRLINSRPGMELDIERLAKAAAAHNVALEVNADWHRLDLRDTHIRAAVAAGAKLAICTDAHDTGSLDLIRFGVITARRGWAQAADVLNTYPAAKLAKWLKK